MKLDYTNYKMNESENFYAYRSGNHDIKYDVLSNIIYVDRQNKKLTLSVDDFYESENMNDIFAKSEGIDPEIYFNKSLEEMIKDNPNFYEDEAEQKLGNDEILDKYAKHFKIYDDPVFVCDEERIFANENPFSGKYVDIPLGEGILDFCYTDFNGILTKSFGLYSMFSEEMIATMQKTHPKTFPKGERKDIEIRDKNDQIIHIYEKYTLTLQTLENLIFSSIYTACFPPAVLHQNNNALNTYYNFLNLLQKEMLEMIEFCYDETFYPSILEKLHPCERYAMYRRIKKLPVSIERNETFNVDIRHATSKKMPFGTTASHVRERIVTLLDKNSSEYLEFKTRFSLTDTNIARHTNLVTFISNSYSCDTLYDMLLLEFTKMLENEIRFKKCKNCNKYFILKGNYKTDYCDRIASDKNQTCQTIGSLKNYKEKVSKSEAFTLYNKYYKRYHARMKISNIENDVFKKWQYQATSMRDDCDNGTVDISDFEQWLHKSFPNNKLKK